MKVIFLTILLSLGMNTVYCQDESKWLSFDSLCIEKANQLNENSINIGEYLYKGSNLDRNPLANFNDEGARIIFYWSTSCRYCKKELEDLKKLIVAHDFPKELMLIAMKIDQQKKEWTIQQENDSYLLLKGDKVFMESPIPIVFISEKFKSESGIIANPHTLILNKDKSFFLFKEGYIVGENSPNLSYLNHLFNSYIESWK